MWLLPYLAALQALKRKRRYEKQLTEVDGTLSTIEFQREALENSYTNTEVLKNMGLAAKAMKAVHENMWVTSAFLWVLGSLRALELFDGLGRDGLTHLRLFDTLEWNAPTEKERKF